MSHEAWFKRLMAACEAGRQSCRHECHDIGYCQECFDKARVTRGGKSKRPSHVGRSLEGRG